MTLTAEQTTVAVDDARGGRRAALALTDRSAAGATVLVVVLGFLILLLGGVAAGVLMLQNESRVGWVDHTFRVERGVDDARLELERMEAARRGWLLRHDAILQTIFGRARAALWQDLASLRRLTADNPVQQANLARMETAIGRLPARLSRSSRAASEGLEAWSGAAGNDADVKVARQARAIGQDMFDEEDRLLQRRVRGQKSTVQAFFAILGLTGLVLVALAIGSVDLILRYLRELARSQASLRAMNDNLERAVETRTRDLQRANDEIQRFAYIVSHDLRSPLVNVLGFTGELEAAARPLGALVDRLEAEAPQLLSADAARAVREDVPEALGFIRTSTEKMDRLINAILRLSREGRRATTPESIQAGPLVQAIADSLHVRLAEAGAELIIEPPLPDVVTDRLGLEQILSNLMENAVKYLKPGRPGRIRVRGRKEGGQVIFEVEDNGRGIAAKDHERIFELFRRAGAQDQPGEGIGLAHVRAMAYRLGGTVTVRSEPDAGAVFRLTLPRVAVAEPAK